MDLYTPGGFEQMIIETSQPALGGGVKYSQAVKVGDTIYLSGQVSHDSTGNPVGIDDMEMQMRQSYANIQKVLCRQEIFAGTPVVASTIVQIQRLALPEFIIEIKCVAKV